MDDSIAKDLNTLFESDIFKENYFIKIYELLNVISTSVDDKSTHPNIENEIINSLDKNFTYDNTKQELKFNNIYITDNNKTNLGIIIYNFIAKLPDTNFNDKKQNFIKLIKESIKNDSIISDNLTENDIIVDPAELNYMKGTFNLLEVKIIDDNTIYTGAGGLSRELYKYLIKNINKSIFVLPYDVKNHFSNFNTDKLFIDTSNKNAKYKQYNIQTDKPKDSSIEINLRTLKLIHAIVPDYSDTNTLDYFIETEYIKFMKLYNDIYNEFDNINNPKFKLRLPFHSIDNFIGNYKIEYILTCLALAYIWIYCKNNPNEENKFFIYNTDNDYINLFKTIIVKIIEKIIEKIEE